MYLLLFFLFGVLYHYLLIINLWYKRKINPEIKYFKNLKNFNSINCYDCFFSFIYVSYSNCYLYYLALIEYQVILYIYLINKIYKSQSICCVLDIIDSLFNVWLLFISYELFFIIVSVISCFSNSIFWTKII